MFCIKLDSSHKNQVLEVIEGDDSGWATILEQQHLQFSQTQYNTPHHPVYNKSLSIKDSFIFFVFNE